MPDSSFQLLSAQVSALGKTLSVDVMGTNPPDVWRWAESPFFHFSGDTDSLYPDFIEWERTAPLAHRCLTYVDIDYRNDIENVCAGLAIEAVRLGGIETLDVIFAERRPTLLSNFYDYLMRGHRVYTEAGSREALEAIARSTREILAPKTQDLKENELKIGHAILERSAELMDAIVGVGSSKAFMDGAELVFKGQKYSFSISRRDQEHVLRSVRTDTHVIPYQLKLLTNDGRYLARGCIYFEKTPLLDQVTAICVHVKAGEERAIVQTANWSDRQELFKSYVPIEDRPADLKSQSIIRQPPTIHQRPSSVRAPDSNDTLETFIEAERIAPLVKEGLIRKMKDRGLIELDDTHLLRPHVAPRLIEYADLSQR
jgi:hypothetical protein